MTLGDLYPDVRLGDYNYDGGGGGVLDGRTYGKGGRGRRWQGDEERGTGRGKIRNVRER